MRSYIFRVALRFTIPFWGIWSLSVGSYQRGQHMFKNITTSLPLLGYIQCECNIRLKIHFWIYNPTIALYYLGTIYVPYFIRERKYWYRFLKLLTFTTRIYIQCTLLIVYGLGLSFFFDTLLMTRCFSIKFSLFKFFVTSRIYLQ